MQILREFGSRPSAFLLAAWGALYAASRIVKPAERRARLRVSTRYPLNLAYAFLLVATANCLVLKIVPSTSVIGRSPTIEWLFQYLTIVWFVVSIYFWALLFDRYLISAEQRRRLFIIVGLSACLNLATFTVDLGGYWAHGTALSGSVFDSMLQPLRGKIDARPSGLSTEPSIFGSWVVFVWPICFFFISPNTNRDLYLRLFGRILAAVLLLSALLSESRTFLVVFFLQLIAYWLARQRIHRVFRTVILPLIGCAAIGALSNYVVQITTGASLIYRLESTIVVTTSSSTMTRWGSALAAVEMFAAHPVTGVGIGQFTAHYPEYVPVWATIDQEVSGYLDTPLYKRINAFNLYARTAAEQGIVSLTLLLIVTFGPLLRLFRAVRSDPTDHLTIGVLLVYIGGIAWWLSQDLYTYQPGLAALGLATSFLSARRREIATGENATAGAIANSSGILPEAH